MATFRTTQGSFSTFRMTQACGAGRGATICLVQEPGAQEMGAVNCDW
jgi:hypothetical protein